MLHHGHILLRTFRSAFHYWRVNTLGVVRGRHEKPYPRKAKSSSVLMLVSNGLHATCIDIGTSGQLTVPSGRCVGNSRLCAEFCNIMHADGAGTKSSLAYMYWKETGDVSVWRGIAQVLSKS